MGTGKELQGKVHLKIYIALFTVQKRYRNRCRGKVLAGFEGSNGDKGGFAIYLTNRLTGRKGACEQAVNLNHCERYQLRGRFKTRTSEGRNMYVARASGSLLVSPLRLGESCYG